MDRKRKSVKYSKITKYLPQNFRKSKWLLIGTYHPSRQKGDFYFDSIGCALDAYSLYDKVLIAGDFNDEEDEPIFW